MTTFNSFNNKRISYIIVTKNRAQFLDKAISRCRELITPADELIIVDGASVDNTKEVVEKNRDIINLFVSEPDSNGAEAHNKGLLLSRGKYIRLMPDDDIVFGESMERAVEILEKHPEIDVLVCGGTKDYVKKEKKFLVYVPPGTNYGKRPEDAILYGASGAGHIVRRSTFAKVGLISSDINSDVEFVMRCIKEGCSVRFARLHLYYHSIYSHSALVQHKKEYKEAMKSLIKRYCSFGFYAKYLLFGKTNLLPKYEQLDSDVWDGGFS